MSNSISTLLTRNLHEVFGENDPARRRVAIDEIFTEDCVFYDPMGGVYRGRDELDRIAGAVRATHFDFRYQPIAEPQEVGNGGRVQWLEGRPGEAPAHAGTDFIVARDGGLPLFISFSTSCPELDSGARLPLAGGTGNHRDLTIARMSRFSKTTPPRSAASRTATSTMARAKSSAGITWLGNSTRNTG